MNTISLEELTAIETRNKEAQDLFWAQYRLTIGTGTEADRALVEDQEVTGTVTMDSPQPPVCLSATELDALLETAKSVAALRLTLEALSEHEPSWSDDFLRARAALIGVDATLAGDTVSGQKKTGSAP